MLSGNKKPEINYTQKNILEGLMSPIFEELHELEPKSAIFIINQIKNTNGIGIEEADLFHLAGVNINDWRDTIKQISSIYAHANPQNRSENYPYFAKPLDDKLVIYKDEQGKPAFEPIGLLGLTARNDDSAEPITKKAVIDYLNNLIDNELEYHRNKYLDVKLDMELIEEEYSRHVNLENMTLRHDIPLYIDEISAVTLIPYLINHPEVKNLVVNEDVLNYLDISLLALYTNLEKIEANVAVLNQSDENFNYDISGVKYLRQVFSPLFLAATYGDAKVFNALMSKGMNPLETEHFSEFIFEINCIDFILEAALKSGFPVDEHDSDGLTLLMRASLAGKSDLAKLCLQYNAEVSALSSKNSNALHMAAEYGYVDIVKMLLARNSTSEFINCKMHEDKSPLHLAVLYQHLNVVQILLNSGADVNAELNDGASALFLAAEKGDVAILEYLIAKGANVNKGMHNGITPLMIAVINNHIDAVTWLLTHNADVNARDLNGCTAFYWATSKGHINHMRVLLQYGADPFMPNNKGETPKDLTLRLKKVKSAALIDTAVCERNNPEIVVKKFFQIQESSPDGDALIKFYKVNARTLGQSNLDKAFRIAAANGYITQIEPLIAAGANPLSAGPSSGKTILHFALEKDRDVIVKFILSILYETKYKADILRLLCTKDNKGITPAAMYVDFCKRFVVQPTRPGSMMTMFFSNSMIIHSQISEVKVIKYYAKECAKSLPPSIEVNNMLIEVKEFLSNAISILQGTTTVTQRPIL